MYSPAYVAGVYLIKFLLRNLSYSPCSEPSRTQCIPATRLNAIRKNMKFLNVDEKFKGDGLSLH